MSVIGDFTIPSGAFALEHALSAFPEVTVEGDRLASHSTREVFPFLWAAGGDLSGFQTSLKNDPTVNEVTVAEDTGNEALYRLRWEDDFCDLINEMIDHHAAILEAEAQNDQWRLKLRFAEERMVSDFRTHFREAGRDFAVHQLSHPSEPRQQEFGLTDEQQQALVTAVSEGYFQVPRATSMEDLGDILDLSSNAVSQRLRRGTDTIIRNALTIGGDTEEGS